MSVNVHHTDLRTEWRCQSCRRIFLYERWARSNFCPYCRAPSPIEAFDPVDRSQRELVGGGPVTEDHRELKPNGQQKDYVVLSAEERAKGFVRPVRDSYIHSTCGVVTKMGTALAETYARDPRFYSGTFCVGCGKHLPVAEFVWDGTNEIVGS